MKLLQPQLDVPEIQQLQAEIQRLQAELERFVNRIHKLEQIIDCLQPGLSRLI